MKSLLKPLFLIVVFLIFLSSCKKSSPFTLDSIIGKWNIQRDSTSVGVGSGYHRVIYSGQPGDYFNFTPDGHIYSMENSILDTFSYTISSGSIMIPDFGYGGGVGKGRFQSSSDRSLTISSGYIITPGGIFGRTVSLKR